MWISLVSRGATRAAYRGVSMTGDTEYFRRRALEEKAASIRAANPAAQNAHIQMARRYEELAKALATHEGAAHGI